MKLSNKHTRERKKQDELTDDIIFFNQIPPLPNLSSRKYSTDVAEPVILLDGMVVVGGYKE